MTEPIRTAVLTISDRCTRGEAPDTSGPAVCEQVRDRLGAIIVAEACVPDEVDVIVSQLTSWAADPAPDLILTTGGTGLAPRDLTPEATRRVIEREHPGLIQLMLMRCYQKTPKAFLSRGVAGTRGRTLIINLPGSRKGSVECIEALLDVLPHAIATLRDDVRVHHKTAR